MIFTPKRHKLYLRTCAPSEDSDQTAHAESSLGAILIVKDAKFLQADNKRSDQTARMRRLNWVYVVRTYQKVHFLTLRRMFQSKGARVSSFNA